MWYIHIFALFELYLVQLDYKTKLSCCTPHRRGTTISLETKPVIHTLLITMPAAGARPKATKIYLIDCAWSRNLPKTQHTSYTHTLTLLKYFSSASHDSHFQTIWLVILYNYYFYIFLLFYVFPVYRVHVPFKAVFFLICVLCRKKRKSIDWTARWKEMCSSERGELTIRSWELRGLSLLEWYNYH